MSVLVSVSVHMCKAVIVIAGFHNHHYLSSFDSFGELSWFTSANSIFVITHKLSVFIFKVYNIISNQNYVNFDSASLIFVQICSSKWNALICKEVYQICHVFLQALSYLQTSDVKLLHLLLPNTRVFARVAPKQKVSLSAGYFSLWDWPKHSWMFEWLLLTWIQLNVSVIVILTWTPSWVTMFEWQWLTWIQLRVWVVAILTWRQSWVTMFEWLRLTWTQLYVWVVEILTWTQNWVTVWVIVIDLNMLDVWVVGTYLNTDVWVTGTDLNTGVRVTGPWPEHNWMFEYLNTWTQMCEWLRLIWTQLKVWRIRADLNTATSVKDCDWPEHS